MNEVKIENLAQFSKKNKEFLEKSTLCGCYFCSSTFHPNQIKEWTDEGETGLCPICGIDSVVGDQSVRFNEEYLSKAKEFWF